MKRSVCFLLAVFIVFGALAQNSNNYFVSGTILNKDSIGLFSAHIKDLNSGNITTSDNDGNYILAVDKLPATIEVTHTGYKTQSLTASLDKLDKATNTVFLNFVLDTSSIQIPDVVVTPGPKVETFFDPYKAYIFDYTLRDNGLLLLVSENGERRLLLLDVGGKTLIDQPITEAVYKFEQTCNEYLYLCGEEYVHQLDFSAEESYIGIGKALLKTEFEQKYSSCADCIDETCMMISFEDHAQTAVFRSADRNLDIIDTKYKITNKTTLQFNEGAYNNILAQAGIDPIFASTTDLNKVNQSRELEREIWFYQKILSKPIYCPIKQLNDSLYIFDHVNDKLAILDAKGQLQTERAILYDNKRKPRLQEIITDYNRTTAYAYYLEKGLGKLKEIDLISGHIIKEITLSEHRFPERVTVKGNYVYYLYKELGYDDKYKLYRQMIN